MSDHDFFAGLPLVLGGNVFGWTADGDEGFAVLDAFYEAGGRMIDTADIYSAWIPGHVGGESESYLGRWLSSRGVRKEMRIHTKTGMLTDKKPANPGEMGDPDLYQPEQVMAHLDASLERLQTDYLDLYYAHRDYEDLQVSAIVDAFDQTVQSGKVRALGASNFKAGRLKAALAYADEADKTPFTALQNEYNLVARDSYGKELQYSARLATSPCCRSSGSPPDISPANTASPRISRTTSAAIERRTTPKAGRPFWR